MVLNLLSNALKFTEPGKIVVSVGAGPSGGAELTVSDTGIGIPPAHLKRIGEPFFQAHGKLSRSKGGSGLGLALVREMMALHGGEFYIASREGLGTEVTLRFPRYRSVAKLAA